MKKKVAFKKLTLNRETLRQLTEEQMNGVAGQAIITKGGYSQCDNSCGIMCTVRSNCRCD